VEETGGSIKASVLYAEPLYIQAETIDFPELKQVILADANNVVMSDNLDAAIEELLGKQTDTYATKSNAGTSTVKITGIRTIDDNIDSIKKVLEDLQIDITYLEEGLQNLLESIGDKK
jgi:uncharacterized membrane protein (UPF0182 family)